MSKPPRTNQTAASSNTRTVDTPTRFWGWPAVGFILLLAILFLACFPAIRGGFIWDDDAYVTDNWTLRTLHGLKQIWFEPLSIPQYYPLVHTTFWLEYHAWQLNPLGYHSVNVFLHALGAFLLWRLLLRLRVPGAWLGAALWALHPVAVESVAWVTELKNVLSAVCYFASALAYLRFRPLETASADSHSHHWKHYFLALLFFACALLSKTVTCSLPAALLLVTWWKNGKIRGRDVLPLLPFFALGLVGGGATCWLEKHNVGAEGADFSLTFLQRCLIAGRVLWFYAGKLVWPAKLIFIYPRWEIDTSVWWQWLFPVAAAGVVVALWLLRKRIGRGPLVAVLFFVGTLVPALGFINVYPMRFSFVADHFQYLAAVGLITLAAAGLSRVPKPARIILGLLPLGLALITWRQAHAYDDLETLWRDTLAKNPGCWMAYNNLGVLLDGQDREKEAMVEFQAALKIKPDYTEPLLNVGSCLVHDDRFQEAADYFSKVVNNEPPTVVGGVDVDAATNEVRVRVDENYVKALNGLGTAHFGMGQVDQAIEEYKKILQLSPKYVDALNNLGSAYVSKREYAEAIQYYKTALSYEENNNLARFNLGKALEKTGNIEEATAIFQHMLIKDTRHLDPAQAAIHVELGNILAVQQRYDDALKETQVALRLAPRSAEVHYNCGILLGSLGKLDEAQNEYRLALQCNTNCAEAQNNLGVALATQFKLDEAIPHYLEALRIKPFYAEAHNNLADALIKEGKIASAKPHCLAALQSDPDYAEAHFHLWQILNLEGDRTNAVSHLQTAVRLKPDWWAALNDLAWVLATDKSNSLRNGGEALRLAERADTLTGKQSPFALDTLAAAYAENGRFAEAAETAQKAADLAAAQGYKQVALDCRARVETYKANRPYRE